MTTLERALLGYLASYVLRDLYRREQAAGDDADRIEIEERRPLENAMRAVGMDPTANWILQGGIGPSARR
jgi:hypothetical protein